MTPARRLLALPAGVILVGLVALPVWAQASIVRIDTPTQDQSVPDEEPRVAGEVEVPRAVDVESIRIAVTDGDVPDGCALPDDPDDDIFLDDPDDYSFDERLTGLTCNGDYSVTVTADIAGRATSSESRDFIKAAPARPVRAVSAEVNDDRSVTISWRPDPEAGADHRGFVVFRDGQPFTVQPAAVTIFTDNNAPAEGEVTYEVTSLRAGVDRSAPVAATADLSAPPADPGPPGDDGGGDDGGAISGGGGGSGGGGSRSGAALPDEPGARTPSAPSDSGSSPPTTTDTGFEDRLNFGDREPGGDDPVLPEEDFASSVQRFTDDGEQQGMLVPVASALVLVLGALHLRHLNRMASRPTPALVAVPGSRSLDPVPVAVAPLGPDAGQRRRRPSHRRSRRWPPLPNLPGLRGR